MNHTNDNYKLLIQKLDQFIRKYYINQLIRGALHSIAILSALFVTFVLLEHYVFSNSTSSTGLRKGLFYGFIGVSVLTVGGLVLLPLVRYFRLGKVISHEQAANIIGQHFQNVQDKLINVLQLRQQKNYAHAALIQASVNQKVGELKPVPFRKAIDLRKNRKYLRFVLPPIFLFLVLLFSSNIIESSTERILNNDRHFEREALFSFNLPQEQLQVVQYENYELKVKVEGQALPNEVFIEVDNYRYKMNKNSANEFSYTFVKVQEDKTFQLSANGFDSKPYDIDVLEKPNILSFEVALDYPAYTGRKDEVLNNTGDLVVPAGTQIDWDFIAQNTEAIGMRFSGSALEESKRMSEEAFTISKRVLRDGMYTVFVSNKNLPNADSVSYSITVQPDLYPTIQVKKYQDSLNRKLVYFAGEASDDYGLRSLTFNYQIERKGKKQELQTLKKAIKRGKQSTYEHILDVELLDLQPGDKLRYYFEVRDNDAVNGSKSARTQMMVYEMPTLEEVSKQEKENNEKIKDDIEAAIKEAEKMKRDIKEAKERLIQKKELDWQDRKDLERLIEKQKNVQERVEQAKKSFDENLKNQEEFQEVDEELRKKQEKIDELFEEVMSEEMQEMFRQLEEMLEQMNREEIMEQLEDMEVSDEEMENELDQMLELFKKLEVEKELSEMTQKLDSLAERQEELSEQTEKMDKDSPKQEELQKEQENIQKEFEKLQEQMEDTEQKNEQLERPFQMPDTEQQEQDIQQNMKNSSDFMKQQQNQKSSKSQKNAAKQMREMAEQMRKSAAGNSKKQMEEDLQAIRQLLENLVTLSHEQEELIDATNKTMPNTPAYRRLVQQQFKIKGDFKHVEDSLQALAKRVFQLQSFITDKVTSTKKTLKRSIEELEERRKRNATVEQQYTMTTLNDLALMLSEAMNQMQQQLSQQMPGQQMCEKPGQGKPGKGKPGQGGEPSFKGMQQMQQQMKEQLEQMQKMMKNGKMPGSEKFAKMAAKQAAIRKALREMQEKMQQKGKGSKELQDIINSMDKIEEDLVNKRLPGDMKKRQEDILTRLLEAENAERERDFDKKRESKTAANKERKMPPSLEEYLKKRQAQVEMYRTVSPSLTPYYKNLVESYFNELR